MTTTEGRELTAEERAHQPIHEELNVLRKRIGELEDQVRNLEVAHSSDGPSEPVPDRKR